MKNITEEKKVNVKIPNEINKKILKNIFINLIIAICFMLYLIGINILSINIEQEILIKTIKSSTLVLLGIGLILMEIAYKKESGKIFIHSLEVLVLAAHSLSIMHVIKMYNFDFKTYILTSSYISSIYYILKSIVIYTKGIRDYSRTLSDISEIVKKDEPLKKEATKKSNEDQKEVNKKEDNKIEEIVTENKPKKRGRPKKEKTNEEEAVTENKPKKRGRPKKETVKQENTVTENKPKKRGRPKKEVKVND